MLVIVQLFAVAVLLILYPLWISGGWQENHDANSFMLRTNIVSVQTPPPNQADSGSNQLNRGETRAPEGEGSERLHAEHYQNLDILPVWSNKDNYGLAPRNPCCSKSCFTLFLG